MNSMIDLNWADVVGAFIVLAVAAVAAVAYLKLEHWRIRAADRREQREFEARMATAQVSEYNGETYEWTPGGWQPGELRNLSDLARYAGPGVAETAPFAAVPGAATVPFIPVPSSMVSGPLPVITSPAEPEDPDDFLAKMRADTAAFMAKWDITPGRR